MNGATETSDSIAVNAAALDELEARAWLDMYKAAPAEFSAKVGLAYIETPAGVSFAMKGIGASLFNRFVLPRGKESITPDTLCMAMSWLGDNCHPTCAIDTRAGEPDHLEATLREAGFHKRGGGMAQFWRTDAAPVPTVNGDLEIRQVGGEAASQFGRVIEAGYGLPLSFSSWLSRLAGRENWLTYLAYDEGTAVAGAEMYVIGSAAWLGVAATMPRYRGNGAQGGLIARRLADGTALGARTFAVQTGAPAAGEIAGPSYRNIERSGFALSHVRQSYEANAPVVK